MIEGDADVGHYMNPFEMNPDTKADAQAQAEAWHAEGLAALADQRFDSACAALEAAVKLTPERAWFWCNLGHARMQQARALRQPPHAAVEALRTALALRGDYELARYNLASALIECGEADAALEQLDWLCSRNPGHAEYLCARADAERIGGHWRAARRGYRAVLDLDPGHVRAESNLGALLAAFGDEEQALRHCEHAVELAPESWQARRLLGRCHVQREDFEAAMTAFADAFELNAEVPELCVDIARVWQETGDLAEAVSWYRRALHLQADVAGAQAGIASILLDQGQSAEALALIQGLTGAAADDVEVLRTHALCVWQEGDADAALALVHKAMAAQPDNAGLHALAGQILASAGQVEAAHAAYLRGLELNPRCVPALSGLATSQRSALDVQHVQAMQRLLERPRLRDGAASALHGGLAQYHDGRKDWAIAAEHMNQANARHWAQRERRGQVYSATKHAEYCQRLRSQFDPRWFERVAAFGNASEEPVFIVGMPRSGTTLTEQILARHPAVLGIGERSLASQAFQQFQAGAGGPAEDGDVDRMQAAMARIDGDRLAPIANSYLEQLAALKQKLGKPGALRVVDKMPDNYLLLGWIATLFPRARIIHCRRDLRDVAVSCWLTQFGKIEWASRWPDLLDRIQHYQAMMRHWRTVLPGRFLETDYEAMVADQEASSRRLIDWLGLDWDPACLEHYASDSLVRTASITQVRQPIYSRSVARWQAYLPHLPELARIEHD